MSLVLKVPDELKIFEIKLYPKILEQIDTDTFDFETLDYMNITNLIKKGVEDSKGPSMLTYVFDDIYSVPENLLKSIDMERKHLLKIRAMVKKFN